MTAKPFWKYFIIFLSDILVTRVLIFEYYVFTLYSHIKTQKHCSGDYTTLLHSNREADKISYFIEQGKKPDRKKKTSFELNDQYLDHIYLLVLIFWKLIESCFTYLPVLLYLKILSTLWRAKKRHYWRESRWPLVSVRFPFVSSKR